MMDALLALMRVCNVSTGLSVKIQRERGNDHAVPEYTPVAIQSVRIGMDGQGFLKNEGCTKFS